MSEPDWQAEQARLSDCPDSHRDYFQMQLERIQSGWVWDEERASQRLKELHQELNQVPPPGPSGAQLSYQGLPAALESLCENMTVKQFNKVKVLDPEHPSERAQIWLHIKGQNKIFSEAKLTAWKPSIKGLKPLSRETTWILRALDLLQGAAYPEVLELRQELAKILQGPLSREMAQLQGLRSRLVNLLSSDQRQEMAELFPA